MNVPKSKDKSSLSKYISTLTLFKVIHSLSFVDPDVPNAGYEIVE